MIPILYLSHTGASIGGGEKQLYYLLTHLDRKRYEPVVVFPEDGVFADQVRKADIPSFILNLPHWRRGISRFSRKIATTKLTELAKKHNIQLVHTSDSWFNPYILKLKNRLKIPVISHVRNLLTSKQVSKYSFSDMDYIISISEKSKIPLIESGISKEKIEVILNCVDLNEFTHSLEKDKRSTEDFTIGIVGRIEPFKQQKTFVEIANEVNRQSKNVQFQVIGDVLEIPKHQTYFREVQELVVQYGLENVIHFTGHRNDIPKVMQEIDLLVTLSAGSVIAEAMASGKPVIGTTVGSTSDMIVEGLTGWVIQEDSIELMADRIVQLYKDPKRCEEFGVAARKHAESHFGIDQHVNRIQNIYEKLLGKK